MNSSNLLVYLCADFILDFTGVARENSQVAVSSGVDNVDIVQRNSLNLFRSLLDLTSRNVNKLHARPNSIKIFLSVNRTSKLGDSSYNNNLDINR